jgi:UTP:GlnB (protein PII) uridylyltransferase
MRHKPVQRIARPVFEPDVWPTTIGGTMAAREYLLLSATEPDRSGLVAELTAFIAECGCNVEDSRIVVLGGYAGIMLLLSGASAAGSGRSPDG